jgi:hypothetical protein
MPPNPSSHWLDLYGNRHSYQWQVANVENKRTYYRPLGLVEFAFDGDGRYYEGRADMNTQLELAVKSTLGKDELHERIQLAWAVMQNHHPLAKARAIKKQDYMAVDTVSTHDMFFAIDLPVDEANALLTSKQTVVFLDEHFENVDHLDFYLHAQNTARAIDPAECLAKLFVYPLEEGSRGLQTLRLLMVGGHQIQDGLSNYLWLQSLTGFLNQTATELQTSLKAAVEPSVLAKRLPPPQEAIYPAVSGSRARSRWFWLLTRILRHVRTPHGAGFANPLRRKEPLGAPITFSPVYSSVLDYTRPPVLNTATCGAHASLKATNRLHRICKSGGVTVGAGAFALVAIIMMEFYESQNPDVPLQDRKPFITGFPLNPRP